MKLRSIHPFLFWLLICRLVVANTFTADSSFPGDTRKAVTTPGAPWRCIGKLSLPNHRFMTATLVGPDLILTAAHGLVKDGQLKPGHFIFRPDFGSRLNRTGDFATVTRAWLGSFTPEWKDCVHSDWAILRLDAQLGDAYGTLAVDDVDNATLAANDRVYYMASYNRDFKHGVVPSWQTGCGFVSLDPLRYLLHDFSTANGASGSPIFYFSGPDRHARIVALNVAEKSPSHETLYGVPFSPRLANVALGSHEFFQTLHEILGRTGAFAAGQAVSSGAVIDHSR